MKITQQLLRHLFLYDSENGLLYWKARDAFLFEDKGFSAEHSCKIWNSRYAGKLAGAQRSDDLRYQIMIFGKLYFRYELIWFFETGNWPIKQIDHENHITYDDRFENLRDVSHKENSKNLSRRKSALGITGVRKRKDTGRYEAYISIGQKKYKYLGVFDTLQEAVYVREQAEIVFGFHENHGK